MNNSDFLNQLNSVSKTKEEYEKEQRELELEKQREAELREEQKLHEQYDYLINCFRDELVKLSSEGNFINVGNKKQINGSITLEMYEYFDEYDIVAFIITDKTGKRIFCKNFEFGLFYNYKRQTIKKLFGSQIIHIYEDNINGLKSFINYFNESLAGVAKITGYDKILVDNYPEYRMSGGCYSRATKGYIRKFDFLCEF